MALLVCANGRLEEIVLPEGDLAQLKKLQELVGGFIELRRILSYVAEYGSFQMMFLNEEQRGLPANMIATAICANGRWLSGAVPSWDQIVGDVVLCKSGEVS